VTNQANKCVFLTGASAGIGLEIARLLTANGYEVWGTSRQPEKLPILPRLHPVFLDLMDMKSIHRAFTQAFSESGGIDILINNAGEAIYGPIEALVADGLKAQIETLLFAPLELVRLALPTMRERNMGLILNITSLAVHFPIPFAGGYSTAKAAFSAATECLRMELAHTGVQVVDVQPGDVVTSMMQRTRHIVAPECTAYEPNLSIVWKNMRENTNHAIPPEVVAQTVLHILQSKSNPPPVISVGNFFQKYIAQMMLRFTTRRMQQSAQRVFYGLK
jgi:short-subunit dehydrogenase